MEEVWREIGNWRNWRNWGEKRIQVASERSELATELVRFNHQLQTYDRGRTGQKRVRAVWEFQALEEDELSLEAGEPIIVLDASNKHWWRGSNCCEEGLFPASFVTQEYL